MESTVHSGLLGNVTRGRAEDVWDELDKEVKRYESPIQSLPIQNVQTPRIQTQLSSMPIPFRPATMPSPAPRPLGNPATLPKPTGFDPSAPETETWNRTGFTEANDSPAGSKNMMLWGGLAVSALIVAGYFFLRK